VVPRSAGTQGVLGSLTYIVALIMDALSALLTYSMQKGSVNIHALFYTTCLMRLRQ